MTRFLTLKTFSIFSEPVLDECSENEDYLKNISITNNSGAQPVSVEILVQEYTLLVVRIKIKSAKHILMTFERNDNCKQSKPKT